MIKSSLLLILGAFAIGACSSPQSTAKDAHDAQHEANETKAYANEEVRLKNVETRRNAEAENYESFRVGASKSEAAQADANQAWVKAKDSLSEARIEARDENEEKLAILDKHVADLKPSLVQKFSPEVSTKMVNDLAAKSAAVRQSINALRDATADSLEAVKSTIAQRLTDYDRAINEAKKGV